MRRLAAILCIAALPSLADTDDFVEANLLSIFYHELGHAMIDTMELPVFGQEEDAADVASILLIDELFVEEDAISIAYDAAFGFLGEAEAAEEEGYGVAWWDVHGPDLQRYYNLVCLFAGADMSSREDIAEELGLPEDRLETCEEEHELAIGSWGPVFDDMAKSAPADSFVYTGGSGTLTERLIGAEVEALNLDFALPTPLKITVESCDEPNAFYDPNTDEIIMCSELEDWLRELAP
ncbi:MAG: DUF4344 domain-containing metallopeptidase [Marinovum sp.]|nr:DUF4344 domain-containing metallopeptidase [Marinovum sp.]